MKNGMRLSNHFDIHITWCLEFCDCLFSVCVYEKQRVRKRGCK